MPLKKKWWVWYLFDSLFIIIASWKWISNHSYTDKITKSNQEINLNAIYGLPFMSSEAKNKKRPTSADQAELFLQHYIPILVTNWLKDTSRSIGQKEWLILWKMDFVHVLSQLVFSISLELLNISFWIDPTLSEKWPQPTIFL